MVSDALFAGLIDERTLTILKLFSKNPEEFYHINQVAELTKVPLASTFRIMRRLLEHHILSTKKIGKFKIYYLAKNEKTLFYQKHL